MIEERRWLGSKTHDIHGGGGQISTIKWKKNLIAWANQKVRLTDRWIDRQIDRWTDRQIDRQTDKLTDRQSAD